MYLFYSADGISGWSQSAKLAASDESYYDYFGSSVSVWGNVTVVGAVYKFVDSFYNAGVRHTT